MLTDAEQACLAAAKARLASGEIYPSADAYYADRDDVRTLEAKAQGLSPRHTDPVGHWHGRQSN